MRAPSQRYAPSYFSHSLVFHWNVPRLFQFNSCLNLCPSITSMLTVLEWQKSSVLVCLIAFDTLPSFLALFSAEKVPRLFAFRIIFTTRTSSIPPFFFSAGHVHKNQWDAKLLGITYVVLPNKFDPRYIRHLRVSYESMAEYTIEKCSILTSFWKKKNFENKQKMRPRAPLDFQKRMIN